MSRSRKKQTVRGHRPSPDQVSEVLRSPDKTDEIEFNGLTVRIHTKLTTTMHPPCTLLVLETGNEQQGETSAAFSTYPELAKNVHELRPLAVLRSFTESFGLMIRVGSQVGKLILQESIHAAGGKEQNLIQGVEPPRGSFSQHLYLRVEEGPPRVAQVALAFAVDDELYGVWLSGVVGQADRARLSGRAGDKTRGSGKGPRIFPADAKWKLFEKLVAAIHRAEQKGAEVKWNDKINKRQFDVTVRFRAGNYDYLTVVECRDKGRPLKVAEVDEFVTKSRDAGANKAIMVSSEGFQEGCFEVAERHGVELFTVQEVHDLPEELLENSFLTPALNMYGFRLDCGDEIIELQEQRNILPFLVKSTFVEKGGRRISIERIVDDLYFRLAERAVRAPQVFRLNIPAGSMVELPDIKSGNTLKTIRLPITAVEFSYALTAARVYSGGGLDPHIALTRYEFRNAVSGESKRYRPGELAVGFDTEFRPGAFYVDAHTEFNYFCHQVEGDLITMTMLEGSSTDGTCRPHSHS